MSEPESDLSLQLSLLQQVLQQTVSLRDPSDIVDEPPPTLPVRDKDEPHWQAWHAKKSETENAPPSPGPDEPIIATGIDCSALRAGDMLGSDVEFCAWNMITAYPNMFIGKTNKPRAQPFFDDILSGNSWDFFYLHDPRKSGERPRLLVQSAQFEDFLRKVNRALRIALTIPPGVNKHKFCLRFGSGGTPRPRYLLRSENRLSLEKVSWPKLSMKDMEGFNGASKAGRDAFISMFATTSPRQTPSKAHDKQARALKRTLDRQSMMAQAQELLGLRDASDSRQVVLVSMDLEALETPPHPVTEVGIAILDTSRVRGVPPDAGGCGWWSFIEAHHLRTKEFSGLVNNLYVRGCPDAFDFGTSVFPSKAELADAIRATLKPYTDDHRRLIFVGHDTKNDTRYLRNIGLDVNDLPGMEGEIDTMALHQAWLDCQDGRRLGAILSDLCISTANLHNAGNDAVYTMRAMVGLALEKLRKDEADLRDEDYVPALWEDASGD